MSVCKMEKLTVVVPRASADALVRRLMRLRAVSLTDATAGEAPDAIARSVFGIELFMPYIDIWSPL